MTDEPPRPLEETDPELAEHIRLIVAGQHAVKRLEVRATHARLVTRDRRVHVIPFPRVRRNTDCPIS